MEPSMTTLVERPVVLVAEDMGVQVRLTTLHLERAGCAVVAVPDGIQALERSRALLPNLIILDVDMPGMNGFQVLDHLRKDDTTRHIPILMLTAHAKDAPLFAEWAEVADHFMAKPYTPDALVAQVNRILALKGASGQNSPEPTGQTERLSG